MASPERVAERIDFHRRLESEDAAAAQLCQRALVGPVAWWANRLRQEDGHQTAGVVRALLTRYRDTLLRSPPEALTLPTLAAELAVWRSIEQEKRLLDAAERASLLNNMAACLKDTGAVQEAIRYYLCAE